MGGFEHVEERSVTALTFPPPCPRLILFTFALMFYSQSVTAGGF